MKVVVFDSKRVESCCCWTTNVLEVVVLDNKRVEVVVVVGQQTVKGLLKVVPQLV